MAHLGPGLRGAVGIRGKGMNKIILFGNRVFAENLYYHLAHDSSYEVVAFTVDRAYVTESTLCGLPVVAFETVESVFSPAEFGMLLPISFQQQNRLREQKYLQAKAKGYTLVSYVSSRATVFPNLSRGENTIILDNSVISPFVQIGNNVMITDGVIIGHHTVVKDHCFVAPGAVILGRAILEERCFIGANSTVKEEVRIARESLVGVNATITRNTTERGVYITPSASLQSRRSDQMTALLSWSSHKSKAAEPAAPNDADEAAQKPDPDAQ